MTTLLVTGGAGFIGSCFIRHIINKYKDYKVINLDALTYAGNIENLDNINYIEFFAYDRGSECKILILKERSRNSRVIGVDDDGEDIIEWLDSSYGKIFQLVEHARIVLEDKDSGAVKLKYTTVATTLQVVPGDDVFTIQTVCEPNAI